MKKVFVVGGDGDAIGTFKDGVDLVRAVTDPASRSTKSASRRIRKATPRSG